MNKYYLLIIFLILILILILLLSFTLWFILKLIISLIQLISNKLNWLNKLESFKLNNNSWFRNILSKILFILIILTLKWGLFIRSLNTQIINVIENLNLKWSINNSRIKILGLILKWGLFIRSLNIVIINLIEKLVLIKNSKIYLKFKQSIKLNLNNKLIKFKFFIKKVSILVISKLLSLIISFIVKSCLIIQIVLKQLKNLLKLVIINKDSKIIKYFKYFIKYFLMLIFIIYYVLKVPVVYCDSDDEMNEPCDYSDSDIDLSDLEDPNYKKDLEITTGKNKKETDFDLSLFKAKYNRVLQKFYDFIVSDDTAHENFKDSSGRLGALDLKDWSKSIIEKRIIGKQVTGQIKSWFESNNEWESLSNFEAIQYNTEDNSERQDDNFRFFGHTVANGGTSLEVAEKSWSLRHVYKSLIVMNQYLIDYGKRKSKGLDKLIEEINSILKNSDFINNEDSLGIEKKVKEVELLVKNNCSIWLFFNNSLIFILKKIIKKYYLFIIFQIIYIFNTNNLDLNYILVLINSIFDILNVSYYSLIDSLSIIYNYLIDIQSYLFFNIFNNSLGNIIYISSALWVKKLKFKKSKPKNEETSTSEGLSKEYEDNNYSNISIDSSIKINSKPEEIIDIVNPLQGKIIDISTANKRENKTWLTSTDITSVNSPIEFNRDIYPSNTTLDANKEFIFNTNESFASNSSNKAIKGFSFDGNFSDMDANKEMKILEWLADDNNDNLYDKSGLMSHRMSGEKSPELKEFNNLLTERKLCESKGKSSLFMLSFSNIIIKLLNFYKKLISIKWINNLFNKLRYLIKFVVTIYFIFKFKNKIIFVYSIFIPYCIENFIFLSNSINIICPNNISEVLLSVSIFTSLKHKFTNKKVEVEDNIKQVPSSDSILNQWQNFCEDWNINLNQVRNSFNLEWFNTWFENQDDFNTSIFNSRFSFKSNQAIGDKYSSSWSCWSSVISLGSALEKNCKSRNVSSIFDELHKIYNDEVENWLNLDSDSNLNKDQTPWKFPSDRKSSSTKDLSPIDTKLINWKSSIIFIGILKNKINWVKVKKFLKIMKIFISIILLDTSFLLAGLPLSVIYEASEISTISSNNNSLINKFPMPPKRDLASEQLNSLSKSSLESSESTRISIENDRTNKDLVKYSKQGIDITSPDYARRNESFLNLENKRYSVHPLESLNTKDLSKEEDLNTKYNIRFNSRLNNEKNSLYTKAINFVKSKFITDDNSKSIWKD